MLNLSIGITSLLLLLFTKLQLNIASSEHAVNVKEYCVIGAGPGGLQMAYFLQQSNRDYIVYEKGSGAATFYTKYPIHRKLISLNKIQTGKTNKEFNFRHDWNSLISDDVNMRLTNYTKDFFPNPDFLVQYLKDYVSHYNLNIQYNTTIENIRRKDNNTFSMNDQYGAPYACRYVVIATGISAPNLPEFEGSDLVLGYEDIKLDLKDYERKDVLIIGHGNAAFEAAEHVMTVTNSIHIMARTPIKMAWSSHYVGHLRAVNSPALDTIGLRSLDGVISGAIESYSVVRNPVDGRLYLQNSFKSNTTSVGRKSALNDDNALTRNGYDVIIRCVGFKFDDSLFHKSVTIQRTGVKNSKKYPLIDSFYESVDVPGVYFAGANSHSLDHERSAGAFIHGYRYTTRTLHRLLEWRHYGIKWPYIHFKNVMDVIPHTLKRFNEASDIYQMFGVLCDVIIYNEDKTEATYLDAFPCQLAHDIHRATGHSVPGAFIMVSMEYAKPDSVQSHSYGFESIYAHQSYFLHPVLYYYKSLESYKNAPSNIKYWILPLPDEHHHIIEDFLTKFDAPATHILTLRRFIERTIQKDLRLFFADQCLKLALTVNGTPLGCKNFAHSPSSNALVRNVNLESNMMDMPSYLIPFQALKS